MMNTKTIKNAIQWHEGMLLLPQHFQQNDRRFEDLITYQIQASHSYPWGILNFSYDIGAIVNGIIRIITLEAIFPDGFVSFYHAADDIDLFLDLNIYQEELRNKKFYVYVSLPEYYPDRISVNTDQSRFKSVESQGIIDENTGENITNFSNLKPNLSLKISERTPNKGIAFPLLFMQKNTDAYQILTFIPPHLKVTFNSPLGQMCQDLIRQIREKIAFLSDRLFAKKSHLISTDLNATVTALSRGLLPFEAMLSSNQCHPFEIFLQLTDVASHLLSISPGQIPPSFLPYNHNDVYENFFQVIEFCHKMLGHIQEGYSMITFTLDDRIFSLKLEDYSLTKTLIIGVKASATMSEKDVTHWISQALIATDDKVTACREKRILGANRHFISSVEELKLLPSKDMTLFSLDLDPEFMTQNRILQIFNVADRQDMRPESLVMYQPKI